MTKPIPMILTLLALGSCAQAKVTFKPLSQGCEEALALSALPVHLRPQANVHVLQAGQFQQTIHSAGGFHCLVERNHPDAIIPQCVTPSGAQTILPGLKFRTLKTLSGMSPKDVQQAFKQAAEGGQFKAPTKPGINYMMSAFNHIYLEDSQSFRDVPAHVMFFAPNISNEDIGGSAKLAMQNTGYPFVGQAGIHGYMISMVEQAADSAQVVTACEGQL